MTQPRRILITGSRDFVDRAVVHNALDAIVRLLLSREPLETGEKLLLDHGGAQGLDTIADQVAKTDFADIMDTVAIRPNWQKYGRSAAFRRDADRVAGGGEVAVAFPMHPQGTPGKNVSKGTWTCINAARNAGIPSFVVWQGSLLAHGPRAAEWLGAQTQPLGDVAKAQH